MSQGVEFPKKAGSDERPTTGPAKEIWFKAFECVDKELAQRLVDEKNFRKNYARHLDKLTCQSAKTPELTMMVAKNGLDAVHDSFDFIRGDECIPLKQAMEKFDQVPLSGTVSSENDSEDISDAFSIPSNGMPYKKEEMNKLIEEKYKQGQLEQDVVDAFKEIVSKGEQFRESLKDTYFVLIGATSELCPFEILMKLGLNVVALARPNPKRQAKLIEACRNAPKGATLTLPVMNQSADQSKLNDPEYLASVAGIDVITHAPEVKNWLLNLFPGKKMVIGQYVYLDGKHHVRASVAIDVVLKELCAKRPDTGLMMLGTPAVVYPITKEAYEDSVKRAKVSKPVWQSIASFCLGPYENNVKAPVIAESVNPSAADQSKEIYMYGGGVSVVQGPNYFLAKTIQNWRAMVAREEDRCRVSVNMAPVCATDSVMHVPSVARAVRGLVAFPPLTYYQPETAKAIMGLLMIFDMCSENSAANPQVPLRNPLEIFATLGVHGGLWRSPFTSESLGKSAYVADLVGLV